MEKKRRFVMVLVGVVLILGFHSLSYATPTIKLFDGVTTITVADGDAADLSAVVGSVAWSGAIGVWNINVTTGITKPAIGSADSPKMDLNSVDHSTGAGTLTVTFSEIGFNPFPVGAALAIGGTTDGSASATAYYDAGNALFVNGGVIGSLGPFSPIAFSGTTSGLVNPGSAPYSLTLEVVINHTGEGTTSFNDHLTVPEPASLLLLGLGLFGIGILGRKKK